MATAQSKGMSKISSAVPTPVFDEFVQLCKNAERTPSAVLRDLMTELTRGSIKLTLNPATKELYK